MKVTQQQIKSAIKREQAKLSRIEQQRISLEEEANQSDEFLASLQVFQNGLARAQEENDREGVRYMQQAIYELLHPPKGPIDRPLKY